jgi:tRNA threonylcarbamoyl adenosine modification protein YeaZ
VIVLAIETATTACSVALFEDDRLVARHHEVVGRGHAERLVPMIGELPGQGRADRILVDCGPGSFTGVRVGLAAARGLALGWGVPVAGFSSLALIAAAGLAAHPVDELAVAIPGGHGELFVQCFATGVTPLGPLLSLTPDAAGRAVTQSLVLGAGAEALVAARGHGTAIAAVPDASEVMRLPPTLAALSPTPLYGRAPDAKLPA